MRILHLCLSRRAFIHLLITLMWCIQSAYISLPEIWAYSHINIPQTTFTVLADPHVYDPSLGMEGDAFEQAMRSEIKLFRYSDQLLKSALDEIALSQADWVLIPGDLTKDGERASHLLVAKRLHALEQKGIQVYVVPGNHDIDNPHAVHYTTAKPSPTPSVSAATFKRIYADFGYTQAIARDEHSLSYVAQPAPGFWLLALDSCRYAENLDYPITSGALQPETLAWAVEILKTARKQGTKVIGCMHHALVENFAGHAELLPEFILQDHQKTGRILAAHQMPLVFTGHTHVQDATFQTFNDGTYILDIQTGSLAASPHAYRLVQIFGGLVRIQSRQAQHLADETEQADFEDFSREFTRGGLEHKAGALGLTWPLDAVFAQAAWAHMQGDEYPGPETQHTLSVLSNSPLHIFSAAGSHLDSVWNDLPPADNNCLLYLPWNLGSDACLLKDLLRFFTTSAPR